jgi:hypothetical protein
VVITARREDESALALPSEAPAPSRDKLDADADSTVVKDTNGKEALLACGHGCRLQAVVCSSALVVLQRAWADGSQAGPTNVRASTLRPMPQEALQPSRPTLSDSSAAGAHCVKLHWNSCVSGEFDSHVVADGVDEAEDEALALRLLANDRVAVAEPVDECVAVPEADLEILAVAEVVGEPLVVADCKARYMQVNSVSSTAARYMQSPQRPRGICR